MESILESGTFERGVSAVADPSPVPFAHLTPTQLKVLQGVHSGLLNKQIAFDLGIAEATVKAHMTALMRKLNVRNRTQVALAAQKSLAV
ncbi:MAG: response regulator transcription factor [Caulobacter sp.]|nr:response regulator transcription factor [Caulobacter sp.]